MAKDWLMVKQLVHDSKKQGEIGQGLMNDEWLTWLSILIMMIIQQTMGDASQIMVDDGWYWLNIMGENNQQTMGSILARDGSERLLVDRFWQMYETMHGS